MERFIQFACAVALCTLCALLPYSANAQQECTPEQSELLAAVNAAAPLAEAQDSCEDLPRLEQAIEALEKLRAAFWPEGRYCRRLFDNAEQKTRTALPALRKRLNDCNQIAVAVEFLFERAAKPEHIVALLLDDRRYDPSSTWPAPLAIPPLKPGNHELAVCMAASERPQAVRVAMGETELARQRPRAGDTDCPRFRFEAKPGDSLQIAATLDREPPLPDPLPTRYELRFNVSETAKLENKQVKKFQKSVQAEVNGQAMGFDKAFLIEKPATLRLDYPAHQGRRWYQIVAHVDDQPVPAVGPEVEVGRDAERRSERYAVPYEDGAEKLVRLEVDSDKHPSAVRDVLIVIGQGITAVGVAVAALGIFEDNKTITYGGAAAAVVGGGMWLGASAIDPGREMPPLKHRSTAFSVGWKGTF